MRQKVLPQVGLLLLLIAAVVGYGASSWQAARRHIRHDLDRRTQLQAELLSDALMRWTAEFRALGFSLEANDDLDALTRTLNLYHSEHADAPLPMYIFAPSPERLLGGEPVEAPNAASALVLRAQRLCAGSRHNRLVLSPSTRRLRGQPSIMACLRLRDADGVPLIDILGRLHWPPVSILQARRLTINPLNATTALAWIKPDEGDGGARLAWLDNALPGFEGVLRTADRAGSGHYAQDGVQHAWVRLSDWPMIVVSSLSERQVWHVWLRRGGAGVSAGLLLLLTAILAFAALRSIRLARSEGRLRQYYGALKDINQSLMMLPQPGVLYQSVCTLLVDRTELPVAWVGLQQGDRVNVIASAGPAHAYVDGLSFAPEADKPEGLGPTGRALRSGSTVVVADLCDDPQFSMWASRARRYGLRSSVAVPFGSGNGTRGVLAAYSTRKGFFSQDIVDLLEQLARDIELGLSQYARVAEITRLSQHDPLTGLPNRTYFMDNLERSLVRVQRSERLIAIGILDLDDFKGINDVLGHVAGDELLKHLAGQLPKALRQGDMVARLGGDEFGIFLEGVTGVSEIEAIAERILSTVRRPVLLSEGEYELSSDASLGLTLYPLDDGDAADLLRHADEALYAAKGAGRHRWHLFDHGLEVASRQRYHVHHHLPEAIASGHIVFHYQPQVDMETGRVIGAEALARWIDPEKGLWSPAVFMPMIESDTRLARALGRHALAEAARAVSRWHADERGLRLSVNVCARHLLHVAFLDDLDEVLARYPEAARVLTLELTETAALADLDESARVLADVRARGLRVALDDFGSGYASLQYVRHLPLDEIKLDLQFVQDMEADTEAFAVGYAALELAELRGAQVVAEGVEIERTACLWRRLGGRLAQGYLFAKPMAEQAWLDWVASFGSEPRFLEIPRWRPSMSHLPLLQALPRHAGLKRLLGTQADSEGVDGYGHFSRVLDSWDSKHCPLTAWLDAAGPLHGISLGELESAHERLHATALNRLARHEPLEAHLEASWERFIHALDDVIAQMDLNHTA
ncbi:hypothetical protein BI364_05240 [Acidihalobacter yilgarnensis]|uniref:Diguanylate cyclase n=1 Tax=Acidihalobacter yilgarnensis TaxID=2819280 RepID=A0A1D8ILY7_9GAMM|nr:EAL domain-containing protein [Acidihalobacter yilgarnensis]AOU97459.1 hypothetical protein BI364_05240 [Acidihalobacter yilgarnensis]